MINNGFKGQEKDDENTGVTGSHLAFEISNRKSEDYDLDIS